MLLVLGAEGALGQRLRIEVPKNGWGPGGAEGPARRNTAYLYTTGAKGGTYKDPIGMGEVDRVRTQSANAPGGSNCFLQPA